MKPTIKTVSEGRTVTHVDVIHKNVCFAAFGAVKASALSEE